MDWRDSHWYSFIVDGDAGKPELGLAFHNNIAASKGTADMVRRLEKAGVPYEIIATDTVESWRMF